MAPDLRSLLLGSVDDRLGRRLHALAALAAGVLTFVAYAVGVFAVSGGVILLPWHATLVGLVLAVGVGYRGGGLALAWLSVFAPLFGFNADWAFFGLSSRSFGEQVAYLLEPEGLAVFAVASLVFGTAGFALGVGARRFFAFARRRLRRTTA